MDIRRSLIAGAVALAVAAAAAGPAGAGDKPVIPKSCGKCHKAKDGVVRGTLGSLSNKAGTLKVEVDEAAWLFDFDDGTALTGVASIGDLGKDKEVAVTFEKRGNKLYARALSAKKPFEVSSEQLVDTDFVVKLVEKSPAEGGYTLVDCRPGAKYEEGHIRHSVSMPFFAFDKMHEKILPQQKDELVVFYCGGVT